MKVVTFVSKKTKGAVPETCEIGEQGDGAVGCFEQVRLMMEEKKQFAVCIM